MSDHNCPCGGNQSCIVLRRSYGDWVHEDDILKAANLPVRKNCVSEPTPEQCKAIDTAMQGYNSVVG